MKKILFVINTLGRAGAETALLELLRVLAQKEYEISVYVMLGQGELAKELPSNVKLLNTHYKNESVLTAKGRIELAKTVLRSFFRNGRLLHKAGMVFHNLCWMCRRKRLQADKLLWRILAEGAQEITEEYDLAVAYLEGASTYFVAESVRAVKKAAFLHIDYGSAGYTKELDRGCYRVFDRIFAVSDEVRERFLDMYPQYRSKMYVFHNLVDQERIRTLAQAGEGFADGFSGFRILTVGRLDHQKAYDIAIRALAIIKKAGLCVRWYVLGEGSERKRLENLSKSLKVNEDFILYGSVDNPYPYYRQCDLYVHATRFEGKSIAVQEALTLGCAVLASDCSGNREQLTDGVDGRFCELSPEGLASGIQKLLLDEALRKRLGKAAAQKTTVYTKDMDRLLELFHSDT